jgi:general secretion pathway protein D
MAVLVLAAIIIVSCTGSRFFGQPGIARQAVTEETARRRAEFDARQAEIREQLEAESDLQSAMEAELGAVSDALAGPAAEAPAEPVPTVFPGTGEFVRAVPPEKAPEGAGEITLNFENTDIREVVKVILSDMLGLNYILDPRVKGGVTMQTGTPLSLDALLPTLETLLRMNGAALVYSGGAYQVVPVINAIRGRVTPQLGDVSRPLPEGYSVRVVPLQYISVAEMSKILTPLAPEGSIIRADSERNILLLAGTSLEMANLVDTIRVFDVDWMAGLSVGFFPLQYTSLEDITTDLNVVFGDQAEGPLAGMLRLVPIESANGLLVVTPQEKYLAEVKTWIQRFDRLGGLRGDSERLFVYRVRNGLAADLADLLNELYGERQARAAPRRAELAPGAEPVTIASAAETGAEQAQAPRAFRTGGGGAESGRLTSAVVFVADEINNSLLIMATPADYEKILAALKQLDVTPLQVLVEATILEVSLADDLRYGIQWFFNQVGTSNNQSFSLFGGVDSAIGAILPGFNWSLVTKGGDVRALLSAFAGENLIKVLSSPSVMVMDNRTARIQVGDEVPIATSQQSGTDVTSTLVNNIEYRDTGVVLEVTPRVNPGGLVTMEISQEVSTVSETQSSDLDSPTIQTRKITTTVAVQNNQTVVLGGLIEDASEDAKSGIPGLHKVPIVGDLFGETVRITDRKELVVILTPKVIRGEKDVLDINQDFRRRLKGLEGKF